MDPDPGGPKTYGSDGLGFGFATLLVGMLFLFKKWSSLGNEFFSNGQKSCQESATLRRKGRREDCWRRRSGWPWPSPPTSWPPSCPPHCCLSTPSRQVHILATCWPPSCPPPSCLSTPSRQVQTLPVCRLAACPHPQDRYRYFLSAALLPVHTLKTGTDTSCPPPCCLSTPSRQVQIPTLSEALHSAQVGHTSVDLSRGFWLYSENKCRLEDF